MSEVYWTMKNGKKISVDDMDVQHLRNALKMVIRNIQNRKVKPNKQIGNIESNFLEEQYKDWENDFYDDFFYGDFRDEIQKQNAINVSKSHGDINFNVLVEKKLNDFFTVVERKPQITFDFNNFCLTFFRAG